MPITPRIMIVDSVSTSYLDSQQNISLTLLSRSASAEFYNLFPEKSTDPEQKSAILKYAENNAIHWISKPQSSFRHQNRNLFMGTGYHLGDVVTEKAAFDNGYVLPHIDTVVNKIVEIATNAELAKPNVTDALREQSLITPDYSAFWHKGNLHVFSNERAEQIVRGTFFDVDPNREPICAPHPINLMIFPEKDDGERPIGVLGFHVPKNHIQRDTVYEFMSYLSRE